MVLEKYPKIINSIKLCIWGRDKARNLKFGMKIFNVVYDGPTKGFLELCESNPENREIL